MHSEYKTGKNYTGFDECGPVLYQPHVTGQQMMLLLPFCALYSPRRIVPSSAENPQSGWLGSKENGSARNSKNIDWRATSLIKETLGLWFWGAYSTNFPNQPDILAFLADVPWGSTEGFLVSVRETSPAMAPGQFFIWFPRVDSTYWGQMLQINVPETQAAQARVKGEHQVLPMMGLYFTNCLTQPRSPPSELKEKWDDYNLSHRASKMA